jgi:hypothetical protein
VSIVLTSDTKLSPVYKREGAEHHRGRLLDFFRTALQEG